MAVAALVSTAGLVLNVRGTLEAVEPPLWDHLPPRFWQDVHMAEALYLFGEFPVSANAVVKFQDESGAIRVGEQRPHFARATAEAGLTPAQFWRTVPANRFLRPAERTLVDRYDDAGRPLLLALGFRLLGGIAPFLLFWLGPLVAVPVLWWCAFELWAAGHARAAVVLPLLLGAWPFLADALALAYSTAGFYVLALVAAIPLAAYALLTPIVTLRGLLLRAAVAGVVLAVCICARGGALLTTPAMALGLAAGAWRVARGSPARVGRAVLVCAACLAVLLLPYAIARVAMARLIARTAAAYGRPVLAPQRHALWFGLWTGLGDYDREKGYQWRDAAASAAAIGAGGTALTMSRYDPANETIYRRLILDDIEKDPAWYAGILVRRTLATLTQRKLWPWPPLSGRSLAPPEHPNQGAIDVYYSLVANADRFGVGGWQLEVPMPVLAFPTVAVLALAVWPRTRSRWLAPALVTAAVAAGTLAAPVLITTASAIEPEAFVLCHLLAASLLAEWSRRHGAHGAPAQTR